MEQPISSASDATAEAIRQERVERERAAHTENDVLHANQKARERFPHTLTYPSRRRLFERMFGDLTGDVRGKIVLDYGCGHGGVSRDFLRRGATVHGMDISPVYIAEAEQRAHEEGFPAERFSFQTMDAHELIFPDSTFDLVIGQGILHHLDVERAMTELYRVLKPGGRILLSEPLGDNPLLKAYRLLTPGARTRDERPFSGRDLIHLAADPRWEINFDYCGVLEAPAAMLTSLLLPSAPDNGLLRGTDVIERYLHRHRFLLSWNQIVLFHFIRRE